MNIIIMKYIIINFCTLSIIIPAMIASVPNEPMFCQWMPSNVKTMSSCKKRCATEKGFIHPKLNKLMCAHDYNVKRASIIFSEPKDARGRHNCECVYSDSSPVTRCDPKIRFVNFTEDQCLEVCNKYIAILLMKNNEFVTYCDEGSKIDFHPLQSHTSLVERKSKTTGKMYKNYTCKCGMDLDIKNRSKLMKYIDEIPIQSQGELIYKCQLDNAAMRYVGKNYCKNRCEKYMAYITTDNELFCFDRIKAAEAISKQNEACQCGINASKKKSFQCQPNVVDSSITDYDACKRVCWQYTVLRVSSARHINVVLSTTLNETNFVWCGKIANLNNIYLSTDGVIEGNNKSDLEKLSNLKCFCGLKTLQKETLISKVGSEDIRNDINFIDSLRFKAIFSSKKEVQFSLNEKLYVVTRKENSNRENANELLNYCQMGEFSLANKDGCELTCNSANGYFSQNSSELICFHREKPTEMITFSDGTCECGIILNKGKQNESRHPCIPKLTYPISGLYQRYQCSDACDNSKAYLFVTFPKQRVARCELKTHQPTPLFKKLDSKRGKYRERISRNGFPTAEYPCQCGLISEITSNTNNDEGTSSSHIAKSYVEPHLNNTFDGDVLPDELFSDNTFDRDVLPDELFSDNTFDRDVLPDELFSDNTFDRDVLPDELFSDNTFDRDVLPDELFSDQTQYELPPNAPNLKIDEPIFEDTIPVDDVMVPSEFCFDMKPWMDELIMSSNESLQIILPDGLKISITNSTVNSPDKKRKRIR